MRKTINFLALILLVALAAGCAGSTCSDYADNLFGAPPGCGCLYNAYGCGPFDYPTGYGYATSKNAAVKSISSGKTLTLVLTKQSSTCPSLLSNVSTQFSVASVGKARRLKSPQLGAILLTPRRGRLTGKVTRTVPLISNCSLALDINVSSLPTKSTPTSGTVKGRVSCRSSSFSCDFQYRATLSSN